MKANQTSVRAGIQDILLPMEYFRCLQGDFEGNHPSYACDMSGKDEGRDLFYAPCDVKCVAINAKDGNTVWWQSQNKVRFADGSIDYLTMMVIHDNNLYGIYVGAAYKQGQQIAQEGTAGNANGNHLHVEFAKGVFTTMYVQNAKGYYLPNSIAIETVCFKDDTIFITSANWAWKLTSDVSVDEVQPGNGGTVLNEIPSDFIYESATFKCEVEAINIRRAPSTSGADTGLDYTKGQTVIYDGYVRREGFIWISWISASDGTRRWMAAGELDRNNINAKPYGTFS